MRRGRALVGWWLAAIVVLSSGCGAGERAEPAPDVANALAQRVATLLERNFGEEIAPHHAENLTCAAHVFGMDPSTATRVSEVSTVYAWAYCEDRLPGGVLGDQVSVPAAIHLGSRPSIKLPQDGETYPASIAEIGRASCRERV